MRALTFSEISAMKGNGSSMRTVLKCFIDKGATVYLLREDITKETTERYFLVRYEQLTIPLRAYNLNFYSIYNSALALTITNDKLKSQSVLSAWDIPTPDTLLFSDIDSAKAFIDKYAQCVVKPRVGAHGEGITVGIKDGDNLQKAVEQAKVIYPEVLIQQQVTGDDYRLLFIDYKFIAAVRRKPASIVGDGTHTIRQLVETSNAKMSVLWADMRSGAVDVDTVRGSISKTPIEEIITAKDEDFLEKVPASGETVKLIDKANVSLGGQTQDVTDQVSIELTDKLAGLLKSIDLPFCGIDVLSTDIGGSLTQKASYIIELNGAPGLRLHELPTEGQPRQVCNLMTESLIKHYMAKA